jgi:hypothetical protein
MLVVGWRTVAWRLHDQMVNSPPPVADRGVVLDVEPAEGARREILRQLESLAVALAAIAPQRAYR